MLENNKFKKCHVPMFFFDLEVPNIIVKGTIQTG